MKFNKVISCWMIIVMVVTSLFLTGCVNTEENIIIKKDGSASVDLHINIDRDAYIKECCEGETEITAEEIQTIDDNMEAQGAKIITVDGKEYYRMTIVANNKLNNKELLKEFYINNTVAYITGNTFYWKTSAKAIYEDKLKELKLDEMGITMDQLMNVPMNISVQFSNEICHHVHGKISADSNKKIVFTFKGDKQYTLFASTKESITLDSTEAKIAELNATEKSKVKKLEAKKVNRGAKKAAIKFTLKSVKATNGYQIQYGTSKSFKSSKTKIVKKTSGTLSNLKRKTKYYMRVRVRKSNYAGINVYGKWSSTKSVKTK